MAFVRRASITDCGAMTFTGNTIGLSQRLFSNDAGDRGSIGAFISLDPTLQVATYPVEPNTGTTLDWRENGSRAVLNMPAGSTVLYAELIWGGDYLTRDEDISADIDTTIKFNTPLASYTITQEPATAAAYTFISGGGNTHGYYIRSQDVTLLVKNAGAGTYSVEGIPGLVDPNIFSTNETCHCGWTLAVIYYNPTLPVRNMNLYVGAEGVVSNAGVREQDIFISGFLTPSQGNVRGRVLVSAGEGDAIIPGDQMLFGPDLGFLNQVSGPNNPALNFFGSQINDDSGQIDTSGSYGDRNHNPATATNVYAGRQGWDITNVDVSPYLDNEQTSAVVRVTTERDAYMPNTIGIQIDSSPIISAIKVADKSFAQIGDTVTYTIVIKNTGQVDAFDVIFTDPLPTGTTYVSGSLTVDGNPIANANPNVGVNIGEVEANGIVIVSFTVKINENPNVCGTTLSNQAFLDYGFGCTGQRENTESNVANTRVECVILEAVKSADVAAVIVGNTITYTVEISNTGTVDANNVIFTDIIPPIATFVPNSFKVNGVTKVGANPNAGVDIGSIPAGSSVTVEYQVTVNEVPCPSSIVNQANIEFEYQLDPSFPIQTGVVSSNKVIIPIFPTSFKQLNIDEIVKIPSQKPDIESVLNVLVDVVITETRVIKTIKGTSIGGQKLTGFKLIVQGKLNQKVEYVADKAEQSVHSAHFVAPFSSFIILPEDFEESTNVEVEAFIEDIFYKIVNRRTLFKNVTFRLLAKLSKK